MYSITIDNRGDDIFHADSRGYAFTLGVKGGGANPGDALLAGLCACVSHYVRDYLRGQGADGAGFSLRAEADSTADDSRLARIAVYIRPRAPLAAAAGQELLAHAARCKIYRTLSLACPVTLELEPEAEAARSRGERRASGD